MEANVKMLFFILALSMINRFAVGRFPNEKELGTGDRAMFCAAIISRCKYRCQQRESSGLGMEYVQMNIHYRTEVIKCQLQETTVNEMVSADPPSTDINEVVFNVPCCQQKPTEREKVLPDETSTPMTSYPTASTDTDATKIAPNNAVQRDTTGFSKSLRESPPPEGEDSIKDNQNIVGRNPILQGYSTEHHWNDVRMNIILGFIAAMLLIVLIILALMFYKMCKKKKSRETPEKLEFDSESSHSPSNDPQATSQDGDAVRKKAIEVLAQTVQDIEPPPVLTTTTELTSEREENNAVAKFQPKDDQTGRDYVVLEPVQTPPPPKSARSRSRGQTAGKSEEVMIIGAGRNNQMMKYQNQQSDDVTHTSNFELVEDIGKRGDFTQVVASTAPRPQKTNGNKSKQEMFKERRADSLPENATRRGVEYDKVAPDIVSAALPPVPDSNSYIDKTRIISHVSPFGTSSLDRVKLQPQANIYNVLRGEMQQESAGDYQHLTRSERSKPNGSSLKGINETQHVTPDGNSTPTQVCDDGYVQDFQIRKKRQSPDGKEQRKASYKADGESDKDEAYDAVTIKNGEATTGNVNGKEPNGPIYSYRERDRAEGSYVNGVLRTGMNNTKEYEQKKISIPESVDL